MLEKENLLVTGWMDLAAHQRLLMEFSYRKSFKINSKWFGLDSGVFL
jgi:hypothetical protein